MICKFYQRFLQTISFLRQASKNFGSAFPASCDKSCQQIVSAVEKVKEIKQNINEGRKFYLSLQVLLPFSSFSLYPFVDFLRMESEQDALSTMKQQCSDFAMTRTIESGDLISGLQTRMEGFRISHKKPGH